MLMVFQKYQWKPQWHFRSQAPPVEPTRHLLVGVGKHDEDFCGPQIILVGPI